MSKAELLAGAWLALLMTAACSSEIRGGAAADGDGGASSGAGGKSAASSSSSGNGSGTTGSGATAAVSDGDTATRVARLTHAQYDATVQDLLGIEDSLAAQFAPDALNGFAFDTSIDLEVDARLGPQYRAAAEVLAEIVVLGFALSYLSSAFRLTRVPPLAGRVLLEADEQVDAPPVAVLGYDAGPTLLSITWSLATRLMRAAQNSSSQSSASGHFEGP